MPISAQDLATCLRVLAEAPSHPDLDEAVLRAHRAVKRRRKGLRRDAARHHDRAVLGAATRFTQEIPAVCDIEQPAVSVPLRRSRRCYVCKEHYDRADSDYHQLCPECAQENRARRFARCDLRGRRAVITGGRVKIGFHTALKLLRDGAEVIVTTRFPRDAARRFAAVPDAGQWLDRLHLEGVDLLDLSAMARLIDVVRTRFGTLDILINNAAQTIDRPPEFYREVRAGETVALSGRAAQLSLGDEPGALAAFFPPGLLDETGQPLDLRPSNSWVLRDAEVSPQEWLRVHVVNAFAPFMLTSRLRALLEKSSFGDRYVVQVSAMEGVYAMAHKTARHPHTNMAKAALNMLTRTVAEDYAAAGIHMTSVDTGWVTDEKPHPAKQAHRAKGFRPPLDVIDGAARIYDPIVRGVGGERLSGVLLKDYRSVPW